jgi:hypothetical protein
MPMRAILIKLLSRLFTRQILAKVPLLRASMPAYDPAKDNEKIMLGEIESYFD